MLKFIWPKKSRSSRARSSRRPVRSPESFLYDPFHPTTLLAVTAVMITMALGTLALQFLRG